MGKNMVTSPCYTTPLDPQCVKKVIGCRSLCKAVDQGWIGYFIDNVEGTGRTFLKAGREDDVITSHGHHLCPLRRQGPLHMMASPSSRLSPPLSPSCRWPLPPPSSSDAPPIRCPEPLLVHTK
jgi:hypothetical protein